MDAFFVTGTGRCGTMLLARLFELSESAVCEHETCFHHKSMLDFYERRDPTGFEQDIVAGFESRRKQLAAEGKVYGVCSGHAYFAIPRLWEHYGERARYILMVRRPEDFARSAMARGFFNPGHPNYCAQIAPHPSDGIAGRWESASVLERNLWYWSLVNEFALNAFAALPPHVYRVVRIEDMDVNLALELCGFLGLNDVSEAAVRELMRRRINSSPGEQGDCEHNPFSTPMTFPKVQDWDSRQVELLEQYTLALASRLYGPQTAGL